MILFLIYTIFVLCILYASLGRGEGALWGLQVDFLKFLLCRNPTENTKNCKTQWSQLQMSGVLGVVEFNLSSAVRLFLSFWRHLAIWVWTIYLSDSRFDEQKIILWLTWWKGLTSTICRLSNSMVSDIPFSVFTAYCIIYRTFIFHGFAAVRFLFFHLTGLFKVLKNWASWTCPTPLPNLQRGQNLEDRDHIPCRPRSLSSEELWFVIRWFLHLMNSMDWSVLQSLLQFYFLGVLLIRLLNTFSVWQRAAEPALFWMCKHTSRMKTLKLSFLEYEACLLPVNQVAA